MGTYPTKPNHEKRQPSKTHSGKQQTLDVNASGLVKRENNYEVYNSVLADTYINIIHQLVSKDSLVEDDMDLEEEIKTQRDGRFKRSHGFVRHKAQNKTYILNNFTS